MKKEPTCREQQYHPNCLLDKLAEHLQLHTDAKLAKALNVTESVIRKIRNCALPVGGLLLMRMHEVSAIDVNELRCLMGDRRHHLRVGRTKEHQRM